MKKKILVIAALLITGIFLFSSCYTKRKGIVPCPHGFNEQLQQTIDEVPSEPA